MKALVLAYLVVFTMFAVPAQQGFVPQAFADTTIWTGASTTDPTDWFDPDNWDNGVPDDADTILIPDDSIVNLTDNFRLEGSLTIGAGTNFTINTDKELHIDGGTVENNGEVHNFGQIFDTGSFSNEPTGTIVNKNRIEITPDGILNNNNYIRNHGDLEVNGGEMYNVLLTLPELSLLDNYGFIQITFGSLLQNDGEINNRCVGTVEGDVSGNQPLDGCGVNLPPTLVPFGPFSINENEFFINTVTATDPNSADIRTFSLSGEPAGASIDPLTGEFTWTPTEAQGPGDYSFTITVTDDYPVLPSSDSITVNIHVDEVNTAPTIDPIPDQTITELAPFSYQTQVTDPDIPSSLSYSLIGAPPGALIDSSGLITWTPTEEQGPGGYTFTVQVDDGTSTASTSITITVNEDNQPPSFVPFSDQLINEGQLFIFDFDANDFDLPAQTLTFSLSGAPAGATINPSTGEFTWTPGEPDGPDTFDFTVNVNDGYTTVSEGFSIGVNEVNTAPEIAFIDDQFTNEEVLFSYQVTVTDPDDPPLTKTYSLIDPPSGASISSSGLITWTPTEAQGPEQYTITVRVDDNGNPSLSDSMSFLIDVAEVNVPPSAPTPQDITTNEDTSISGNLGISDPDDTSFTFTFTQSPLGTLTISPDGSYTFTPAPNANGSDTIVVDIFDGTTTIQVTLDISITPVNDPPIAIDDVATTTTSLPATINVLDNDSDVDNDTLTIDSFTQGTSGSVVLVGTALKYTANSGFSGLDSFQYTISDGNGGTSTATVRITVNSDVTLYCSLPESAYSTIIRGTNGNDNLVGTQGNDLMFGYGGKDHMVGLGGNDCMYGGDGKDKLNGERGNDTMYGGNGDDEINGNHGNDSIYGEAGEDKLHGNEGDDYINGGENIDYCKGNEGNNRLEQCERGDTGTPSTKQLTGTIRDFKIAHEDMEQGCGGPLCDGVELGIVKNTLGTNNKPVFNQDTASTNGAANFNQWYNDVSGVNTAKPFTVTLRQSESDPNIYTFNSGDGFFPIDNQMLGNEGKPHNYHFTIELHSTFKYQEGQMFKFTGDDDVWVFIDKKLVLDLGGVHPKTSKTVTSADLNALGLTPGVTYPIDFFFAERQTVESNFRIDTSFGMS